MVRAVIQYERACRSRKGYGCGTGDLDAAGACAASVMQGVRVAVVRDTCRSAMMPESSGDRQPGCLQSVLFDEGVPPAPAGRLWVAGDPVLTVAFAESEMLQLFTSLALLRPRSSVFKRDVLELKHVPARARTGRRC